jgi:hypothetical protein
VIPAAPESRVFIFDKKLKAFVSGFPPEPVIAVGAGHPFCYFLWERLPSSDLYCRILLRRS